MKGNNAYVWYLIYHSTDSTIATFVDSVKSQEQTSSTSTTPENKTVWIVLLFKDQKSADAVRRQLKDLSSKINVNVQPVYNSPKLGDKLKVFFIKRDLPK